MSVSIVIGGQYGSEGKGKVADFWANKMQAVAVVRVGGPNSGHTVCNKNGDMLAITQLPTASIRNTAICILPAGACIDISTLQREIKTVNLSPGMLKIDPNAVIIHPDFRKTEKELCLQESIGSTLSGTGQAVASRVMRGSDVTQAKEIPCLAPFLCGTKHLMRRMLSAGGHIVIEGTQGYGLSNLHTHCYPYATSRDTTAAGFLSESGLSPFDVEHVVMVLRAFPIRVAGNSGPLPNEITWELLTRESGSKTKLCEYTTVTHRVRRVARFDPDLVKQAIIANRPDVIFLNHVDYFDMKQRDLTELSSQQMKEVTSIENAIDRRIDYVGNGPNTIVKL